jgi:hypothetical protein
MNLGYEVVPTRKTAATGQFEIVDGNHPDWRGQRFSDRERAERELAQAVGEPGRFYIKDRSEKKSAAADSTYGDDWDDGDWTNYGAGFDQGAAGHPLGHDTGDDGSGHGQPFKDGHYDGSMTNARSFRSASKTAGDFDSKDCMFCGGKLAFTGSGPKDNDWGGYEHRCLSCGQAQMRDKKVGSLTFTAKEVGYYVCSRNGVPISGPYATRSDAAPNMIEQRGATVMFIGPGDSEEWAALKAKQFPYGLNTVNGSRKTATGSCPHCGTGGIESGASRCPGCNYQLQWDIMHSRDGMSTSSSWETEEDPWAGEQHTAREHFFYTDEELQKLHPHLYNHFKPDAAQDGEAEHTGTMQERYATGQRLATLRHFAEDDEEGPEEDEWFKQPKGLTDQVDTGLAPASEIQDPNPLAGQDLERIPRNLAEAALWAQAGDGLDPYDERHWLDHGTEGTDFNPEDYPEDTPHDQLDDPWNGQENPLGRGWGDPPLGY